MEIRPPLIDRSTRHALIGLALLQGCALYLLHVAVQGERWPATDLTWLKALYTVAIALPAFFYLGMERYTDRRNLLAVSLLIPLLFFLGWHLGWSESPQGVPADIRHQLSPPFVLSLSVVVFILALHFRAWSTSGKAPFDYALLLSFSWQQALTLGMLGLFIGVFWLLLGLWAMLFNAIGIRTFRDLFSETAFIYPVTWLVLGLGLVLIRDRIPLIATVQFMCEALIKALLPLAALVLVLFLAALPVTGLQPIWNTGNAALLMMLLTVVLLFFYNAVLSGETERAYPLPVKLLVLAAILLLPLTSLLAAWALWLRIEQYGLTVDRLWAGLIQLFIAGFTLSYALLLLLKRSEARLGIQRVNTRLALVVATTLILVNTPVADLRAWAAQDQADRLLSGEADAATFDYEYLRFSLGAYGVRELQRIQSAGLAQANPAVAQRIAALLRQKHRWSREAVPEAEDPAALAGVFQVAPAGEETPEGLLLQAAREHRQCLRESGRCKALKLPTTPGGAEWLILTGHRGEWSGGAAYTSAHGAWLKMGRLSRACDGSAGAGGLDSLKRVAGPFLAYAGGGCLYWVDPDWAYLRRLMAGEVNGAVRVQRAQGQPDANAPAPYPRDDSTR